MRCNHAGSCGPSESRTSPPFGIPSNCSSSPRRIISIRGLRVTSRESNPAAASRPIHAGDKTVPALAITSPLRHSIPAGRISASSLTLPDTMSSTTWAFSQRRTAKVPRGMTAPVAIPTAVPEISSSCIGAPAFTSPTILQGPSPATA